jgi:virulence-associated protein VapD
MLDNKTRVLEEKAVILSHIKDLHEELDWFNVTQGLLYSADQLRSYAVNQGSVDEKNNAINNLSSIVQAVNYIGRINDWILRSTEHDEK